MDILDFFLMNPSTELQNSREMLNFKTENIFNFFAQPIELTRKIGLRDFIKDRGRLPYCGFSM